MKIVLRGGREIPRSSQIYENSAKRWEGDTHLLPLSTIWKALIYKMVIVGSLVPAMGNCKSSAQVHELPQIRFDNKQNGTLFSRVDIECTETENKTKKTFC